jgi:type II secretory pathway component PulF
MPKFSYRAKNGLATITVGVVDADNYDNAIRLLLSTGLHPLEITPQSLSFFQIKKRVSVADKALFFKQLGDLTEAEIPLLMALLLSSKSIKSPLFKKAIENVYSSVKDGRSFSDALGSFPDIFSSMHINMIQAGEIGGQLKIALKKVAGFLEKENEARTKIALSLIYPVLIFLFSCVVVVVLLTVVIPRIMVMYEDFSEVLPLPTQVLMAVSQFMINYWWIPLGVLIFSLIFLKKLRRSQEGKYFIDTQLLKLPVLGNTIKDIEIARFSRVLASLLDSGVVMISALSSAQGVLDNGVLTEEIRKAKEAVTQGRSVTQAFKDHCAHITETDINIIAPAEATGRISRGFYKLAEIYEGAVDVKTKTLTALIEPAIILCFGLMVGFILLAALLPILNINMIIK